MLYVFGAFLVFTGVRLAVARRGGGPPREQPGAAARAAGGAVDDGVRRPEAVHRSAERAQRLATPLFAVLVLIETTDVIFAVDSIPAILAVSREQFIVFTSNAFAILGLRALYFLLADLHDRFRYLQLGLAVILAFVGVKMIISEWYHIPTAVSLAVIALVLAVAIVASVLKDRSSDDAEPKLR